MKIVVRKGQPRLIIRRDDLIRLAKEAGDDPKLAWLVERASHFEGFEDHIEVLFTVSTANEALELISLERHLRASQTEGSTPVAESIKAEDFGDDEYERAFESDED